jgi:hypothetical protein
MTFFHKQLLNPLPVEMPHMGFFRPRLAGGLAGAVFTLSLEAVFG